jgi:ABC-2 type transport system ATP-binding protein
MKLEIQNISKTHYNGTKILDNVSLSLGKGVFGLVGPENSGKSSLIQILALLHTPDSGRITLNDTILSQQQINIGYLPQFFEFYPRTKITDFLYHIALIKGMHDEKIRKDFVDFLIIKAGIQKDSYISKCTVNTKRRLGIAQAFLGNPELVILDDPLKGIDLEDRDPLYELINDYASSNIIFLTTSNIEDINNLCNNLAIIKSGRILFQGNGKDALDKLQGSIYEVGLMKTGEIEEEFFRNRFHVISQQRKLGRLVFRIHSEEKLPQFSLARAELQDLYNKYITSRPKNYFR